MVKVEINSENNVLLFKRMNQSIVKSYSTRNPTAINEHKKLFEETHGVKIVMGESGNFWSHMEFPDEQAYTMAVLKWL